MKPSVQVPRRPVVLIILDGFGVNPAKANNAVVLADTPNLDRRLSTNPHTVLQASARAVGLPAGQMGNSEVGHMTLGSGCIVPRYAPLENVKAMIDVAHSQPYPGMSSH